MLISILLIGDLQVSLMQIIQKPKSREAAPRAEGLPQLGARWLTPAGTKHVRLARGCLLPCSKMWDVDKSLYAFDGKMSTLLSSIYGSSGET